MNPIAAISLVSGALLVIACLTGIAYGVTGNIIDRRRRRRQTPQEATVAEYPITDGPMPDTPTPLEEYHAAIVKLEFLLETSTPGPWRVIDDEPNGRPVLAGTFDPPRDIVGDCALISDDLLFCSETPGTDLELIVIGHRAHAAQLQILRAAVRLELELGSLAEFSLWQRPVLELARAINGEAS